MLFTVLVSIVYLSSYKKYMHGNKSRDQEEYESEKDEN